MADFAITVNGLSKSYQNNKAVDDLSLQIAQGEFFGFLGPNGAGKTTTIRMLTGLLKPDQGEMLIAGMPTSRRREISQLIGVVPESRGFYQWMTASEYLIFFARLYKVYSKKSKSFFFDSLAQVGLESHGSSLIGTFSRGMKQRLGLARALINSPQILFLDEPTLGLDPQGQVDIQNLLLKLNGEGVTIFFSSHLLYEVSNLCSRIAIISKGKLVVEGNMQDLQQKAGLKETYQIKIQGKPDKQILSEFQVKGIEENKTTNTTEITLKGNYLEANALIDLLRKAQIPILEYRTAGDDLTEIFLNLTQENRL